MAGLRPVLCVARRLFDVVVFLSLGAIRLAEPGPQVRRKFPQWPSPAARPTVCARRGTIDAGDPLSDLPADSERSGPCCLLAALARIAILAVRTDVVLVVVTGRRLCRSCSASICARVGQFPGPPLFGRGSPSGPILFGFCLGVGAGLCALGPRIHALGLVPARAICVPAQPPAALRPLFFGRRRARGRRRRTWPSGGRRTFGAAVGDVGYWP